MATLSDLFPFAVETALYVDKIRTFLDYETKIVSNEGRTVPHKPSIIRFEDVSFAYTENGKRILNHVNLTIHPEEKIALVGYNGAGKTTLIKLLMRLYDPTEGRITLDGVDIRDYKVEEYRERIGTIFQDYRIYAATVEENVWMDVSPTDGNEERMSLALRHSGFEDKVAELENGLHTQLTREFDEAGVGLSGGESQKLATARVFYKESDLIILDEPSSALDPIAEYQLNRSMTKAAKDKSVIFISHRLSTTRHADRIFMLEKGAVIEEGTHEQLLEMDGKYARMWEVQASKYV
jgi:ATP-binding cassette subfamily B protein